MAILIIYVKSAIILASLGFAASAEFLYKFHKRGTGYIKHISVNVSLWLLNTALHPLIIIKFTEYISENFSFNWRPEWYGGEHSTLQVLILVAIVDLLIIDGFVYFWHRANHYFPFLWRFHQVHHSDRIMDITTGFRFHFGEVALSASLRIIVIVIFDIPLTNVIIAETLLLTISIFHHGNYQLPVKAEYYISKIIVTPGLHWVHHHKIRKDTDSNYANIFSFWDVVFNSRSDIRRFDGMPIGIEGDKKPEGLLQQLVKPFIK